MGLPKLAGIWPCLAKWRNRQLPVGRVMEGFSQRIRPGRFHLVLASHPFSSGIGSKKG
jgi:hypothetical protein